jgi:hypothetical protein
MLDEKKVLRRNFFHQLLEFWSDCGRWGAQGGRRGWGPRPKTGCLTAGAEY